MPDSNQVIRYGRREMIQHEAPAAADVRAGHLVEEVAGGVQPLSTDYERRPDRLLVASDARGRGKELGDIYSGADGERTQYHACSNGGVHLLLAPGESVGEQDELVPNGDGTVRAPDRDGTAPDDPDDASVAYVADDESVDNSGGTKGVPVAVDVVN